MEAPVKPSAARRTGRNIAAASRFDHEWLMTNGSPALRTMRQRISRILGREFVPMEELAYRRLAAGGYSPRTVIDVGAHEGSWAQLAHRIFPASKLILVEPQPSKVKRLTQLAASIPNASFVNAVLSDKAGQTVAFHDAESASSLHRELSNLPMKTIELKTSTLDDAAKGAEGPLFLKLDVQGAELEVLEGGAETLARADLVQLEVALLSYNEGAPTMLEVLSYMDARGLVAFDVAGMVRPTGVELVQMDLLFVRKDSPLRPQRFFFPEYS